jgi:hypothetical protein
VRSIDGAHSSKWLPLLGVPGPVCRRPEPDLWRSVICTVLLHSPRAFRAFSAFSGLGGSGSARTSLERRCLSPLFEFGRSVLNVGSHVGGVALLASSSTPLMRIVGDAGKSLSIRDARGMVECAPQAEETAKLPLRDCYADLGYPGCSMAEAPH